MNRIGWKILTLLSLAVLITKPVYAVDAPNFPSCSSPQGQVIASYNNGTHGIPGQEGTFTGSDTVYTLNSDTVMQCFCSDGGQGMQTNWWKASALTQDQISILESQGWYYIPDGSLWGLNSDPYITQNMPFNCKPGSPQSTNGGGGSNQGDGRSDGRSSCPECTAAPQILSAQTGQILGLADTGDIWILYCVFGLAIVLLGLGSRMLRHSNKRL